MTPVFITWMCLMMGGELVYSKVVTIDNNGNRTFECCVEGLCSCNSFHYALSSIENNTFITITSKVISLPLRAIMGSGNLHNITITGNGATIMCNNSGGVYCESCSDVIIEGITWDQCGNTSTPSIPGISFDHITNLMIIRCVFQWSTVCSVINVSNPEGQIFILASKFLDNSIKNRLPCPNAIYSNLLLWNSTNKINLTISDSLFHHNGLKIQSFPSRISESSLFYWGYYPAYNPILIKNVIKIILIKNTVFSSNGILGMFLFENGYTSSIVLVNVTVFNNANGGLSINAGGKSFQLDISSSNFSYNTNGALTLRLLNTHRSSCNISRTNFTKNKGANYGAALYIRMIFNETDIRLSFCKFESNIGGNSIVYAVMTIEFIEVQGNIRMTSCWFISNTIGSAMRLSQCSLSIYNFTVFLSNSAESGAAMYFEHNSEVTIEDGATVKFTNNTASIYGGAIYADLANCPNHGLVFRNLSGYNSVTFVNNSAGISGHSIYFNIPASCDVVRDEISNDSPVYVPYNFTQHRGTIGPAVATSPYEIKLCSPADCSMTNNDRSTCLIEGTKMLGQSIDFNATVCDYYNRNAEAVQFRMRCINCGSNYQLSNHEILVFNGSSNKFFVHSMHAIHDITDPVNITLNIFSVLSHEYKQFTAILSLTLSSCHNGFMFDNASQHCECYKHDKDIIQCFEDGAQIKQEYWFGSFSGIQTVSICPNFYCNFVHRKETRTGHYRLPANQDDQCSQNRRGPACGECSPGYSLSYDTPDCISNDKCSTGITVLVVALTMLYWIVLIVVILAVMYFFSSQEAPLGCLIGIIYFYSITDIVLVNNLYISDEVFYAVAGFSSVVKLSPWFLGKLCLAQELDAIDQQFIHYCHVLCVWFIFAVILIVARYCNTIARYINRSISLVTGLFLLLSYTTVASTSLQLLRALQYNDVDEVYVYLSPQMEYFTGRHAVYGSVALVCGLVIVLGLPLLLLIEPFLRRRSITFKKIEPLMNRFQECYTEQYSWFAAYYLICRLVIMLIVYFANSDYSYMIYYLQTACVIITMTHVLIRPYKNDILNAMDTVILLTLLLVINPSVFNFPQTLISGIVVALVLFPLCLVLITGIYVLFKLGKVALLPHFKTDESNQNALIR